MSNQHASKINCGCEIMLVRCRCGKPHHEAKITLCGEGKKRWEKKDPVHEAEAAMSPLPEIFWTPRRRTHARLKFEERVKIFPTAQASKPKPPVRPSAGTSRRPNASTSRVEASTKATKVKTSTSTSPKPPTERLRNLSISGSTGSTVSEASSQSSVSAESISSASSASTVSSTTSITKPTNATAAPVSTSAKKTLATSRTTIKKSTKLDERNIPAKMAGKKDDEKLKGRKPSRKLELRESLPSTQLVVES
ncbi:hypothetical protein CC80DRAFT_502929 [Byssothecium circinans]|uniref:Uncharacterized protein n=1 Tax=Byssothecium circinans TaxID=147558 RepID=A0A6A5U1H3_9PLEO|nr:hypothetical protein CC80DRAFT_502929 [Byssothecium circinans]